MLSNNTYNLMMQIIEESKSLQRIKDNYLGDAKGHSGCVECWEKLIPDKEHHINDLLKLLKKEL